MTTLLAPKTGKGAVRVAHRLRHHVRAKDWCCMPGTDFWLGAGNADPFTTANLNGVAPANIVVGLDGFGWTVTSVAFTNTATGDFISSADDTPPNANSDAQNDLLRSPLIFGSYAHALAAGQFLGYMPTKMVCEFYAAFTTASSDENGSYIGLWNAAGIATGVYSDGTNFQLYDGATTEAGAAVDTSYHQWRLTLDRVNRTVTWYIDGVSQGSQAVVADRWPAGFGFNAGGANNRIALSWGHLFYE